MQSRLTSTLIPFAEGSTTF